MNQVYHVVIPCDDCGKPVHRRRSQVKRHTFCNNRCRSRWGAVMVDAGFCEMCGGPMSRKRGVDQHKRFCSGACRVRSHTIRTILRERGQAA